MTRAATALALAAAASTSAADPLANLGAAKPPAVARGAATAKPVQLTTLPLVVGDRGFAVSIPYKSPRWTTFDVRTATGKATAQRVDAAVAADFAYSVVDVDLGTAPPDADAVLDANIASAIAGARGKLDAPIDKTAAQSLPARTARVKLDDGAVLIVRFVLDGRALVGVMAGDAGARSDAKAIVDSLRPATYGAIYGTANGELPVSAPEPPRSPNTIVLGELVVKGELDKAVVRRYIKRNINKLQRCYDKQLVAKPKLAGTVIATFTIDAMGNARDAKASGVDSDVERCIADMIASIEFPKPKHGSTVDVKYPLTFAPGKKR